MSKSHLPSDASHELRALLGDWLRTRHLTQPLQSFDTGRDAGAEAKLLGNRGLTIVGVMDQGQIVGSIRLDALRGDDWSASIEPITEERVIDGEAPLLELLPRLAQRHWLLVRRAGNLDGFVSRSDLQRGPFRMLLFGLISLFELRLLHLVQHHYSEAEIARALTPNRLDKAHSLHAERKNRGEELHLADCLQIADKRDLLLALPDSASMLGFESNNKAYRFFGRVEALRDRLVHANDLIGGSNWDEVLTVTMELADFLARAADPQPADQPG